MFTVNVTGDFAQKILARRDAFKGQKIGALLYAPDALKWWLYQEYGTATKGQFGGSPYSIDPVQAGSLAFPGPDGNIVFAKHVTHPGIPPRHSVEQTLPQVESYTKDILEEALNSGAADDPIALQEAAVKAVENAKELIVQSMVTNIPGSRAEGKLHGGSAAGAFDAETEVRPLIKGE